MKKHEEQLSPEALLLNQYLSQYKRCIGRKHSLERRRQNIIWEFDHPLSGVANDGMPRGSSTNVGSAALSFRLDEIDTRIKEQMHRSVKILADIMDVIEFLPENSIERSIIEYRYIDRMNWSKVCNEVHLTKTPAIKYWRKGLYELLEFKKIQQVIREYEKSLEDEL